MKTSKIFVGLTLVVCLFPVGLRSGQSQSANSESTNHAIVIESGRNHGRYYLRVKPNPQNERDSLHLLSTLCDDGRNKATVLSLVDYRANVEDLYNAQGLASKAQCRDVRTFIVNRESGLMSEVTFGKAVPISDGLTSSPDRR